MRQLCANYKLHSLLLFLLNNPTRRPYTYQRILNAHSTIPPTVGNARSETFFHRDFFSGVRSKTYPGNMRVSLRSFSFSFGHSYARIILSLIELLLSLLE